MSVWHELHLHFHFIADFFCCSVLYPLHFMNVVMLASGNRTLIRLGHHEYTLPELPLDYWKCAGWGTVLLLMTAFSFGRLKYCVAVTLRCDAGHWVKWMAVMLTEANTTAVIAGIQLQQAKQIIAYLNYISSHPPPTVSIASSPNSFSPVVCPFPSFLPSLFHLTFCITQFPLKIYHPSPASFSSPPNASRIPISLLTSLSLPFQAALLVSSLFADERWWSCCLTVCKRRLMWKVSAQHCEM